MGCTVYCVLYCVLCTVYCVLCTVLFCAVVAGLIQSESVAAVAQKTSDKQAEDSGLESGHTSMNNSSDTQSDGGEESPTCPDSQTHRHQPDTSQTPHSLYHRNNVSDSFNLKSSQRMHYYSKLPVTIV